MNTTYTVKHIQKGQTLFINGKDVETRDGTTEFRRLPLWDSPVLLAERAQVELRQGAARASSASTGS